MTAAGGTAGILLVAVVFANRTGGIINPSNLRNRSFAQVLKHAGLPADTCFHNSRTSTTRWER